MSDGQKTIEDLVRGKFGAVVGFDATVFDRIFLQCEKIYCIFTLSMYPDNNIANVVAQYPKDRVMPLEAFPHQAAKALNENSLDFVVISYFRDLSEAIASLFSKIKINGFIAVSLSRPESVSESVDTIDLVVDNYGIIYKRSETIE